MATPFKQTLVIVAYLLQREQTAKHWALRRDFFFSLVESRAKKKNGRLIVIRVGLHTVMKNGGCGTVSILHTHFYYGSFSRTSQSD